MKIVFSDLDGTILDFSNYSYEEALEGMNILKEHGAPLVPVSSKTLSEMKDLHKELKLTSPFVFENGGGIAFPLKGREPVVDDYKVEIIGIDIDALKEKLGILREAAETPIRPLFEMDIEEIMENTNLSEKSAKLVMERSSSIPFLPATLPPGKIIDLDKVNIILKKHRLKITKGGRYYHFSDENADKGSAVKRIIEFYKAAGGVDEIVSIGIGDSENDIPMLEVVDIPFLVKKHDGSAIETGLSNVRITEKIGPAGFTEAMKSIF